jgi:hypothetical protein
MESERKVGRSCKERCSDGPGEWSMCFHIPDAGCLFLLGKTVKLVCARCLLAGATACTPCIAGTYSDSFGDDSGVH